jgi:hypothetical protein
VYNHGCTLELGQQGIQLTTKELPNVIGRIGVALKVSQCRIDEDHVWTVLLQHRPDRFAEECSPSSGIFLHNEYPGIGFTLFFQCQLQSFDYTVAHLSKIAVIVLGLNQ